MVRKLAELFDPHSPLPQKHIERSLKTLTPEMLADIDLATVRVKEESAEADAKESKGSKTSVGKKE